MAQNVTTAAADAITHANATLHGTASNFGTDTIASGRWRIGTATGVYTENIAIDPSEWTDGVPVAKTITGRAASQKYYWVLEITWTNAGVKTSTERNFTCLQSPLAPAGAFW
jgi:hypothetical protein